MVPFLHGDDVDVVIERAVSTGARVLLPATNQSWGERVGRILDPCGHAWNSASRIDEPGAEVGSSWRT